MSTALPQTSPQAPTVERTAPINLTEKAAAKVKQIVTEEQSKGSAPERIYLRVRVVGGGCSGFQHKLDLDPNVNPKLDDVYEVHGVGVVIDKRSSMYLSGVTVDFHDELHRTGLSVSNPSPKTPSVFASSFSL